MSDLLNRWLDGEIDRDELPPELRERAELWERLDAVGRSDVGGAPGWIEDRVMREIPHRAPGPRARLGQALGWLARPMTVRVRPLTVGALGAAAMAMLLLWPGGPAGSGTGPAAVTGTGGAAGRTATTTSDVTPAGVAADAAAEAGVYVQFAYVAPEAGSVTVAGDFNEWSEQGSPLRDPDGDGVWTGYILLRPGMHKYMFVVDGGWVTDPRAERHVDDGFGNRNALISVMPPGSRI